MGPSALFTLVIISLILIATRWVTTVFILMAIIAVMFPDRGDEYDVSVYRNGNNAELSRFDKLLSKLSYQIAAFWAVTHCKQKRM